MHSKKHLWSLYLISITIAISIAVQVYWNYKNYQKNKIQFFNEVQTSLDNATDIYYANLAKNRFRFMELEHINQKDILTISLEKKTNSKSIQINYEDTIFRDSLSGSLKKLKEVFLDKNNSKEVKWIRGVSQDPFFGNDTIEIMTGIKSIFVSMQEDSINFEKLNTYVLNELVRKKIEIPFVLNHYIDKKIIATNNDNLNFKNPIKTLSKSTYLKPFENIELIFPNQTKTHLKKGLFGILLSFLLSLAIISSLFYLLNIIKKQKQLAEIKNDFINNITHEFKTPIATIGIANEAMRNFNILTDKEKTKEYLNITNSQVKKLSVMVEKVLETAMLDNDNILIQKTTINITKLLTKLIEKHQFTQTDKKIQFNSLNNDLYANIDAFHVENAINNILDNAIKYGGNTIEITIREHQKKIQINIADSGTISKEQKALIFNKFYRIPKGDNHDVKGYGIGLYYAKKMIEKHGGTLKIATHKNTKFILVLPL